jgi:RNA polymerase sigma factor (sigma-70 family)
MITARTNVVLRHIRGLAAAENVNRLPDRQLLERFVTARDDSAFEALVRRHGSLVLSVCRRVLHNPHDAEDAFQATFLALARKAPSAGTRASLGTWLYQVAYHTALRARKQSAVRRQREDQVEPRSQPDPLGEVTGRELMTVLDEEMHRLPEQLREPLVLCYLEGKTRDEAAQQLDCPLGTLKRRLEKARACLRSRLERRGLALPTALLAVGTVTAAVPRALAAATTQAAVGEAAVSAQVAGLVHGTLQALAPAKLKTVAAAFLVVALVVLGAAAFAPRPPAAAEEPQAAGPKEPAAPTANEKKEITVSGRVLGADGKPAAGAAVVVLAQPMRQHRRSDPTAYRDDFLAEGKADAEGRFDLRIPRTSSATYRDVYVAAAAEKHAPTWRRFNPDAEMLEAELKLPPEQVIRGSLVDLQGLPAAGVKVAVSTVGRVVNGQPDGVALKELSKRGAPWPEPVTTDEQGRFVIHGANRDQGLTLTVIDDRFATQSFTIDTPGKPRPESRVLGIDAGGFIHEGGSGPDEKGQPEVLKLPLTPARLIEGRVTYADTGKPAAGASVSGTRTDEDGRFHLQSASRGGVTLEVYAPAGEPYLSVYHRVELPKGTVKQEVAITLPRGVLVRGKVTEAGSGKPVAGAGVQFWPRQIDDPNRPKNVFTGWNHSEVTAEDGSFRMAVLPGEAHLLIQGPTPDFIHQEIGSEMISWGRPGGIRLYPDAIVKLDVPAKEEPKEVAVTLRRGATVRCRLLGPDGKPVAKAVVLHRLHVGIDLSWHFPAEARDGVFEIHGLDPEKSVPVHFLDAENQCGATVPLSGKHAGETVTVQLAPCGKATARYVDGKGQPLADYRVSPDMVITPGGAKRYPSDAGDLAKGEFLADSMALVNLDRTNYWDKVKTDAQGRITFPALIPGATYRVARWEKEKWVPHKEFTVESGKTIDLGDIVINKAE